MGIVPADGERDIRVRKFARFNLFRNPMKVSISSRELEILRKAADGLTVKQIANDLNESEKIVSRSQKDILLKIGEANVLRALQAIAKKGFVIKDGE